jgi:hypothetical protein
MSDYMKWMKYRDEEKHLKKTLDDIVKRAKEINTKYQTYLKENPYKTDKKDLLRKRLEYTKKILDLIEKGYDGEKKKNE